MGYDDDDDGLCVDMGVAWACYSREPVGGDTTAKSLGAKEKVGSTAGQDKASAEGRTAKRDSGRLVADGGLCLYIS